jgi:hypothetical protein
MVNVGRWEVNERQMNGQWLKEAVKSAFARLASEKMSKYEIKTEDDVWVCLCVDIAVG